jgi:hypothetical protein
MSQVEVERFLGRLITDTDFRASASVSIKTACFHEGMALSAEEISLLSPIDLWQFGLIAETLDDSLRRK